MSNVIKVNILNARGARSSATISKRVAQAYLLVCTKLSQTDENIHSEMQRIANYETFKGERISSTKILEDFLLTAIESKLIKKRK